MGLKVSEQVEIADMTGKQKTSAKQVGKRSVHSQGDKVNG